MVFCQKPYQEYRGVLVHLLLSLTFPHSIQPNILGGSSSIGTVHNDIHCPWSGSYTQFYSINLANLFHFPQQHLTFRTLWPSQLVITWLVFLWNISMLHLHLDVSWFYKTPSPMRTPFLYWKDMEATKQCLRLSWCQLGITMLISMILSVLSILTHILLTFPLKC